MVDRPGFPMSAAPERLGRYRLIEPIAMGGMAEIHLGSSDGAAGITKLVAIKRIRAESARDPGYLAMFLNEARIAATLNHPNLVQTYDSGCDGGHYFLVMEYLRGQDVLGIVRALAASNREMPLEVAIAIAIGVAAGLHYLHEKRDAGGQILDLVHRDISPGNIFLTSDGAVKIIDFGIAKAVRRVSDTREGTFKGNVGYMSPEQCRSAPLDRRSDIFSLSIVLWELTVERRLFDQPSEVEVMQAITSVDIPSPSSVKPRYPAELERIVLKGLARDRDKRYRTAEEMQIDLERFALDNKLVLTARSLSSFVRALFGNKWPTIAALEPDAASAFAPAMHPSGPLPPEPARPILPRSPLPATGTGVRSQRPRLQFIGLALFVVAGGLGGAWLAMRQRSDASSLPDAAPAPSVDRAPVDNPAPSAPPPIAEPAPDPAAAPAAVPSPAARQPGLAPGAPGDPRPRRDGVRRSHRWPAPTGGPTPEAWNPNSALLPP